MLQCLAELHTLGLVHGDVALHNFVLAPDATAVWLLDFGVCCYGNTREQQAEMNHLKELLRLEGVEASYNDWQQLNPRL